MNDGRTIFSQLISFERGGTDSPKWTIPDLSSLAAKGTVIVSAKILKSQPVLFDEGRQIETIYTLQVGHCFKGASTQPINLALPGGSYTFPDGSKATQTEYLYRPLVQNVEYILSRLSGKSCDLISQAI
jgi:hypothetical protein